MGAVMAMGLAAILSGLVWSLGSGVARARKPQSPRGWAYVKASDAQLHRRPKKGAQPVLPVGRGAVLPVSRLRRSQGQGWLEVASVNPQTVKMARGWLPAALSEALSPGAVPGDSEILLRLGGALWEDREVARAVVLRYLWQVNPGERAWVCFIASPHLPTPLLKVFQQTPQGLGTSPAGWQFSLLDPKGGLSFFEIRDLVGDGRECLISYEPFTQVPQISGVRMIVRRWVGEQLRTVWDVPTEFSNLGSYPAQTQIRQPPELNIGQPATVTRGQVHFIRRPGGDYLLEWEGGIEFYVLGREAPLQALHLKKTFAWDGQRFSSLAPSP